METTRITVTLNPELSTIMRALATAKPTNVRDYLERARWLYENVDRRLFLREFVGDDGSIAGPCVSFTVPGDTTKDEIEKYLDAAVRTEVDKATKKFYDHDGLKKIIRAVIYEENAGARRAVERAINLL